MNDQEESGIWTWYQAHCRCGWIGTEFQGIVELNLRAALEELDEHRGMMGCRL